MLERLQTALADGPVKVELVLHSVGVQMVKKAIIHAADYVGIIAQLRGPLGGIGNERMFPWTAISALEILA
jgi:hypothetical protein